MSQSVEKDKPCILHARAVIVKVSDASERALQGCTSDCDPTDDGAGSVGPGKYRNHHAGAHSGASSRISTSCSRGHGNTRRGAKGRSRASGKSAAVVADVVSADCESAVKLELGMTPPSVGDQLGKRSEHVTPSLSSGGSDNVGGNSSSRGSKRVSRTVPMPSAHSLTGAESYKDR